MRSLTSMAAGVFVMICALAAQHPAGVSALGPGGAPLPPGWSWLSTPDGTALQWKPDSALPMRDARPEFRDGDRLLGYPAEKRGFLVLVLAASVAASVSQPTVWLGNDRLDGPMPDQRFAVAPLDAVEPDPTALRVLPRADDPGRRGEFETKTFAYELTPLAAARFPASIEVVGDVIAPVGAPGARPLVLFLHGRHGTCFRGGPGGEVTGEWPCPPGWRPIPSHRGYRYVARLLASQGYVTVSIAANGINGQDFAALDGGAAVRSTLIQHHLRTWAKWNADGTDPWGGVFEGRVDMTRVVLIGHSRGGEGVERAAVDSRPSAPYRIVGMVAIGPTTFGRQVGLGIPQAVILPYCDGDVSDLQGQQLIDATRDLGEDSALRSSVMMLGANHNFFNTEWTPGMAKAPAEDDWLFSGLDSDQTCGGDAPGRLPAAKQQAAGATYMAALVRLAAEGDAAVAPLLDGTAVRAGSAGRAVVYTHALGANREIVLRPDMGTSFTASGALVRPCRASLLGDNGSISECAITFSGQRLPHWLAMFGAEAAPLGAALDVSWRRAGATARVRFDDPVDARDAGAIELRAAVDPEVGTARVALRLVDSSGAVVQLPGEARLTPLPGDTVPLGKAWARTARFDLAGVKGIDLSSLVAFELVAKSDRGRVWVIDVSTWSEGLVPAARQVLPQVSLTDLTIVETDGSRDIEVPLKVRGAIREPAVLWVQAANHLDSRQIWGRRVTLNPGQDSYSITLRIRGDRAFRPSASVYLLTLKAIAAVTTGRYQGQVRVTDDDPPPQLGLAVDDASVVEGGTIVFRATLSAPAPDFMFYGVELRAFGVLPELMTDDVPPDWLVQFVGELPDPPVPLRDVLFSGFAFSPGDTESVFEIPVFADGIAEGSEGLTAAVAKNSDPTIPADLEVGVRVSDAP